MKQSDAQKADLAAAMRALGHPVRLDILSILAEKCEPQCCCNDVTRSLPLAQSTVSQHIKVLMEAGLIKRYAQGTRNCYSVNLDRLKILQSAYADFVAGLGEGACSAASTCADLTESV